MRGGSSPQKGGQAAQALGRSRGGFSTKIHVSVDGLGNPLRFILTGGQQHDITQAEELIAGYAGEHVLADKGYDAQEFRQHILELGMMPVIPPRSNRKAPADYDRHLYRERHLVECFINKIKHYRRIFSRFEKLDTRYLGFLHFTAALIWPFFRLSAHLVDVRPGGEWRQRRSEFRDPPDVYLRLPRVQEDRVGGPLAQGAPVPEGSVVVGHTPRSVAEILEQDAGERRGYPVKKVEINVHRFIAHLTHKMRFKIVLPSRRSQRQRLGLSASHGTDIVRQRRAKLPQWLDDPLPLFDWAVVAEENSAYFLPTIWEGRQEGDDIHLVGHIGGELADQGEQFLCFVVRVDQVTRQHRWADGMQLVLERGNDAEITPTAPKAPQQ